MIQVLLINGKLSGKQVVTQEKIDNITNKYPFTKDDNSNEYAWALRWATHGKDQNPPQIRTVEIIDEKDINKYERHKPPKVKTKLEELEERIIALENASHA